jgi:hypothetical protein
MKNMKKSILSLLTATALAFVNFGCEEIEGETLAP